MTAAHYKDARVHYPDLKQQPHTTHTHKTNPCARNGRDRNPKPHQPTNPTTPLPPPTHADGKNQDDADQPASTS